MTFLGQADLDMNMILSSEFAVDVTVGGETYRGIFDKTYEEIDPQTGAVVMSRFPRVTIPEEGAPDLDQGSELFINGQLYKARTIERSGQNSIMVKLHARQNA
jgi:hypothetical protein